MDAYHVISYDRRQAEYDLCLHSSSSSSSYARTFTSCWASSSSSHGYGYDIWWFVLAMASFWRRWHLGGISDWEFVLKRIARQGFLINLGFAA
jgi:hypothetical protein